MKNAVILLRATLFVLAILIFQAVSIAQCENWVNSPTKDQAETAHVLYRQDLKNGNLDAALPNWERAYKLAPAADGKRPSHYADGRKILMHQYDQTTDEAKKEELKKRILDLYDQQMKCYGNEAVLLAFKAYDMFYKFRSPYPETYEVLKSSVEKGGKNSSYTVLTPYATIAVYMFTNEKMNKEETRAVHDMLNEIANHNIDSKSPYSAQYAQAQESMNAKFAEIKYQIFDCDYFKAELEPEYRDNADDPELVKTIYNQLRARGCDDADPLLVELKKKYEKYAAEENARRQAEFEANNPGILAKKAYDEGDYEGAIAKYQEAIDKESDPKQKASYYFSMASIEFRKLKNYNKARQLARQAAELRPNWGRPFMLIGDMYASTSRSCGDNWGARLAILAASEKYAYAKSIDPEVSAEASERIAKYRSSYPEKEDGFMRKVNDGDSVQVPCWIGETVRVRFQ